MSFFLSLQREEMAMRVLMQQLIRVVILMLHVLEALARVMQVSMIMRALVKQVYVQIKCKTATQKYIK